MRRRDVVGQSMRNIRRQKLRSALTIFAVMIGATSVTIMLALVGGAQDFFLSQFASSGQLQQVVVTAQTDLDYRQAQNGGGGRPSDTGVKLTDALAAQIPTKSSHIVGLAKTAQVGVFDSLSYQGSKLAIEQVQAYDPNGIITHAMVAGRDLGQADGKDTVILTQVYSDKLGFKSNPGDLVGKQITLATQNFFTGDGAVLVDPATQQGQGPGQPGNGPPQQQPTTFTVTVVGVVADQDQAEIFIPMSWAKGLLVDRHYEGQQGPQQPQSQPPQCCRPGQPQPTPQAPVFTLVTRNQLDQQGYSGFIVKVDDATNADAVATSIRTLGVGAVSAQSFIKQQTDAFRTISLVFGGIGAIALLVAAIGVINTMVMAILERTREIGVLRACGATRRTIRRLFTMEAAILGFLGGACGIAAAYGLSLIANHVINGQLASSSIKAQNIITMPLWLILSVIGATTAIGTVAGLYPAFRAARLEPIEALRYE